MSDRPDNPDDDLGEPAPRATATQRADDLYDDDDPYADELADVPDDAPEGARSERGFASKMIGDLAKRALMTGIGAVFMSEESLKSQLSEMKLPKEAMGYVVNQADKTKKEIVNAIARETREFLSKLEMDKVLARVLAGTTIEIQTRIKILPKEGGGLTTAVESNQSSIGKSVDDTPGAQPVDGPNDERSKKKKKKRDDG